MICPKCKTDLHEISFSLRRHKASRGKPISFHVDQCFTCNGFWFDANELEKYLEYELQILNSPAIEPSKMQKLDAMPGDCPRCTIPMEKIPAGSNRDIIMDRCPQCAGIWLDSCEIDLLENTEEGFLERLGKRLQEVFG